MPDMRPKLLAIVIDGPNMVLLEQWLSDGSLPVIGALMQNGATGRHHHIKQYRNERCWDLWLSGKKMDVAGAMFDAASYAYFQNSLQREDRYEPFFALGEQFRVCAFDLPATISANAAGVQVTGWGSEMNVSAPLSSPPELIDEILERHGPDPKVTRRMKVRDHPSGQIENSYTIPNLYNPCETASLCDKLILSAMRRADICLDLMQREDWDLFLVNFPEIHSANHLLWHLSEAHPMNRIAHRLCHRPAWRVYSGGADHCGMGHQRADLRLVGHLAIGGQHRDDDCDIPDGVPDPEFAKSRCRRDAG